MPTVTDPNPGKPVLGETKDPAVIAGRFNVIMAVINALDNANFNPAAGQELAVTKIVAGTTGQVLKTVGTTVTWSADASTELPRVARMRASFI